MEENEHTSVREYLGLEEKVGVWGLVVRLGLGLIGVAAVFAVVLGFLKVVAWLVWTEHGETIFLGVWVGACILAASYMLGDLIVDWWRDRE